jgi:hypothetical protein
LIRDRTLISWNSDFMECGVNGLGATTGLAFLSGEGAFPYGEFCREE